MSIPIGGKTVIKMTLEGAGEGYLGDLPVYGDIPPNNTTCCESVDAGVFTGV